MGGWSAVSTLYMMEKPFKGVGTETVPSLLCFNSGDSMKKKIERQEIGTGQLILGQLPKVRTGVIANSNHVGC